ncbi:MAG: MotA/TolQ/ExbB proton channel family protein [Bacteroidota bacterium]
MNSIEINHLSKQFAKKHAFSPSFFLSRETNLWLWLGLSLSVLLIVYVRYFPDSSGELSYMSSLSNLFTGLLYSIIFLLALWGILLVILVMARYQVENAIAIKTARNCSEELASIRGSEKKRIALDEVHHLIPENLDESLSMLRLTHAIIEEAKDRRFDSPATIMQPYKEEAFSDIFKVNMIQKAALQLGILGTFIGLIAAFASLNGFGLDTESILSSIIPSLEYAFKTSIAGLLVAIVLSMLMIMVKRMQDRYFKNMEEATNVMLSLVRNAINKDNFLSEFSQINHSVSQLGDRVYEQTQEVHSQTETIRSGLSRLRAVNGEFNGFLAQLSEKEKQFLEEVSSFHQILSPTEMSKKLEESMTQSVHGIAHALKNTLETKMERYDELDQSTKNINESLTTVADNLKKQNLTLESSGKSIATLQKHFTDAMTTMQKSQEDFVGKITGSHFSEKIREDFKRISSEMTQSMSSDLKTINSVIQNYSKELSTFNQNTTSFLNQKLVFEKRLLTGVTIGVGVIGLILLFKMMTL